MYRLLVAEHSKPTDGDFVEIVGHYNPTATDQPLTVNKERVQYWISKGAQPTNSVSKLLNRTGFELPVEQRNRKPKHEPKAVEAPAAAPVAAETPIKESPVVVEETPVAEASAEPAPETGSGEEPKAEEAPASDESDSGKEA
ncbi:30S ribosomal protein S16 [candidate division Kazan bacterium RIFCSPHIGHO2_01_FULL_49_10]|uniref:30S ribosomal protein S16 n=1 Tax=candidate division Kazan bacterium RIFCSPLOWO2_01_FULL_48_13 TaxID=1798539 RepID=A0A1F4PPH8_UNCK3|nr:MAG: 30S ribosomal protein S16 [candidate division Kazan bacterium RIFCSPHIGHO2_01_FULL_49_10]OGB85529.1 MAG: 30S ribosomal protein S16 [candidate division Kazan bacterium RIFCSPLOWO2_01_FULL_48_13]